MNDPNKNDPLLKEILDDVAPEAFRRASLDAMLRGNRRRRALRQGTAVALSAAVCLALLNSISQRELQHANPSTANTRAIEPSPQYVQGTNIRLIDDEELFELFKGRPVALIGEGEDLRLVLLDQADQ